MYISFTSLILVGALTSKPYSFNIRSWELKSYEGLDIMDSGCSLIRFDVCANRILRILPIETTNSQTQWISDRVRFSYDGLTRLRLGYPIFCFKKKFIRLNWHLVFKLMGYIFNRNLVNYCGCSFELKGIVGKFLDCKSSVIFKDFVNGFGGSLCFREQNFPVFNDFKNNFFFTSNFLELTELLIIIGLNPRFELPVLNLKIRNLILMKKLFYVCVLSNYSSLNYFYNHIGNSSKDLLDLCEGRHWFSSIIYKYLNNVFFLVSSNLKNNITFLKKINQYLNLKHYQIASIYFSVGELNTLLFNCLTRFNFNLIEEKNKKKTILRSFFFYFFLGSDFCFDNRNSLNDFCLFQSHHYNIIGLNKSYFTDFVLPVSVFVETDALYLNFEGISLLNRSSLVQTFGTLENFSIFKGFFYVIKSLQAETFYKKTIMRIFEIDKSIFFLNSRFCFFFSKFHLFTTYTKFFF